MESFNVFAALRERYPLGEYAFMSEVRNATGFSRTTRYADALVMSTWPSRGLELMGFEVKVSRSDWLRELKNPVKADVIYSFCDRWYLVVSDPEIVKLEELPITWGLLIPRGQKLIVKVEAAKLKPQPVTKEFLASILRNVTENCVPTRDIELRLSQKYAEGLQRGQANSQTDVERLKREIADYKRRIDNFEAASKMRLDDYRLGDLTKAMELVRNGTSSELLNRLQGLANSTEHLSGAVKRSLELAQSIQPAEACHGQ